VIPYLFKKSKDIVIINSETIKNLALRLQRATQLNITKLGINLHTEIKKVHFNITIVTNHYQKTYEYLGHADQFAPLGEEIALDVLGFLMLRRQNRL
jgi:hypothetical protein